MNPNYLDFEQPIAELQAKIEELRLVGNDSKINISDEIGKLDARYREEIDQLSVKLTKIDKTIETTPAHEFKARPAATGKADELTDC